MRNALAFVIAASLAGCASMQPVTIASAFNPADVAWSQGPGTGTITGQAFFQTRGGQPRTCAGQSVALVPDSPHTRERIRAFYGAGDSGYRPATVPDPKFMPDEQLAILEFVRMASCDAQGNFEFTALPAGRYYVTTSISWVLPGHYFVSEGGRLMRAVDLDEGEAERVILSR